MSSSPMIRHHANDVAYIRGVMDGSTVTVTDIVKVISLAARSTHGGMDYTLIEEVAASYRKGLNLGNKLRTEGDTTDEAVNAAIANQLVNSDQSWRKEEGYWETIQEDAQG